MADLSFVTENALTVESGQKKANKQKYILILGGLLALICLFIFPIASVLVLVVTAVAWFTASGDEILNAGAEGEELTIKDIDRLPDSFTVFNQVNLPNSKSRTGYNEADIVVVNDEAVFIIEVKHNNGSISGGIDDKEWSVSKVGRGGTAYGKTMRNPISQVKKLVWLLSEQFKQENNRVWVQGLVVFSNPIAELDVRSEGAVPVLRGDQLTDYLYEYRAKSRATDPRKSISMLAQLKRQ